MSLECLAKAYEFRHSGTFLRRHDAFSRNEQHFRSIGLTLVADAAADSTARNLARYRDLERTASAVERLHPQQAGNAPDCEYPWTELDKVIAPCDVDFHECVSVPDVLNLVGFIDSLLRMESA
jgi:hypothetical protein